MNFSFLKKLKPTKKEESSDKIEIVAYKHVSRLRMLTILIVGTLIFILGWTVIFTTERINNTIGQAEEFIFLQSELGIEPINFMTLNQIVENRNLLLSTSTVDIARNPFAEPGLEPIENLNQDELTNEPVGSEQVDEVVPSL